MSTYIEHQFSKLKLDEVANPEFLCSIKIHSALGETFWLSATSDDVEQIKEILNNSIANK